MSLSSDVPARLLLPLGSWHCLGLCLAWAQWEWHQGHSSLHWGLFMSIFACSLLGFLYPSQTSGAQPRCQRSLAWQGRAVVICCVTVLGRKSSFQSGRDLAPWSCLVLCGTEHPHVSIGEEMLVVNPLRFPCQTLQRCPGAGSAHPQSLSVQS